MALRTYIVTWNEKLADTKPQIKIKRIAIGDYFTFEVARGRRCMVVSASSMKKALERINDEEPEEEIIYM